MTSLVDNLMAMLARGNEGALLRFSLGTACFKSGELALAIEHLQRAVVLDEDYSAAWKALGQAQQASGHTGAAASSYRQGIAVAERRGDIQAAKEMRVFLKRIERPQETTARGAGPGSNQPDQ